MSTRTAPRPATRPAPRASARPEKVDLTRYDSAPRPGGERPRDLVDDPPADQEPEEQEPTGDEGDPPPTSRSLPQLDNGDASGLFLGIFAAVLFVQYLRGGTAQVQAWLKAKFLNQPSTP